MKKNFNTTNLLILLLPFYLFNTGLSGAAIINVQVGPNFSFTFSPANINAATGDTIVWTWISGTHNVISTSVPPGASSFESILTNQAGYTFSYTVQVEGIYNYTCTPHAQFGMNGTINVTTSSISQENNLIPDRFELKQNYPNPFNSVTIINFSIPASGNVKLSVYNITGNEISVPVNERLNPGNYSVDWDAQKFNSGIYLYKLEIRSPGKPGSFSSVKKMIYLK
jgi:plastocyanin